MAFVRSKQDRSPRIRLRSSQRSGLRLTVSHRSRQSEWSAPIKEDDVLADTSATPPSGKHARKAQKRKRRGGR